MRLTMEHLLRQRTPRTEFGSMVWAEGIGTFGLVFFGLAAIAAGAEPIGVGLSFGLAVLAMIYAFGHISGAHLNPAVSVGFFMMGRLSGRRLAGYIGAQLAGAWAASLLVAYVSGAGTVVGLTAPVAGFGQAFAAEFILTAFLMMVIAAVATDERAYGTMAGIAIGAILMLGVSTGAGISGGSLNPARSFGPALAGGNFNAHWLYWLAPILGSAFGAWVYRGVSAVRQSPAPTQPGVSKHALRR
jgi:aquaporin NIP